MLGGTCSTRSWFSWWICEQEPSMQVLISSGHSPSLMTVGCVNANTGAASAA